LTHNNLIKSKGISSLSYLIFPVQSVNIQFKAKLPVKSTIYILNYIKGKLMKLLVAYLNCRTNIFFKIH